MNLLTADTISKIFADRVILQDASFSIADGDKIGVIGVNGTGKSTLLKLIAGLEPPSGGQITKARGLRIEYLPQQPEFPSGTSILEAVLHGHSPVMCLVREYETALAELEEHPESPVLQGRLISLSGRMDDAEAWTLDSEAKSVLTRLGIQDFRQKVESLSGGQKKRVALAAALVNPADLLILDEPTNHIDPATVAWLEQYLANYKGALLMVTHDRYFLERVTRVMFEIDQTRLYRYEANYEKWLELKAERVEREQASELKRQNSLRRELAWMRRGAKARSTKQKARIDRFHALNETETPAEARRAVLTAGSAGSSRLGRKTLILEGVGKQYDGHWLFRDFSIIVGRDERLGLVGPNGSGKTTLLNILAGQLAPDAGCRDIGSTVRLGFFRQENEAIDPDVRVIDYIRETAEVIQTDEGELSASQMLERFLFPPALQWMPVRKLSGGERRRLALLKVLMGAPNILLLDEPTNDLDIMTLAVLEDYLDGFSGAVVAVSHDRHFLDRVAERILAFGPDGLIQPYEGNFQSYLDQVNPSPGASSFPGSGSGASAAGSGAGAAGYSGSGAGVAGSSPEPAKPLKLRLKMSEKIELESIDARIADLEQRRASLQHQLDDAASDYLRLQDLTEQMDRLAAECDAAMERWVYLNELAEQIETQKGRL